MIKLLFILTILTFTISNAHMSNAQAEEPFINKQNAKTINYEQVKTALKNGASLRAKDDYGTNPLMYASEYTSDTKILDLLLKHGANIHSSDTFGDTALIDACSHNPNPKIIEFLLNHGANIHNTNFLGKTPLMYASNFNSNPAIIDFLLKHGANINAKDRHGNTALMLSIDNKNHNTTKTLLNHDAQPSQELLQYIRSESNDKKLIELFKRYPYYP